MPGTVSSFSGPQVAVGRDCQASESSRFYLRQSLSIPKEPSCRVATIGSAYTRGLFDTDSQRVPMTAAWDLVSSSIGSLRSVFKGSYRASRQYRVAKRARNFQQSVPLAAQLWWAHHRAKKGFHFPRLEPLTFQLQAFARKLTAILNFLLVRSRGNSRQR